MRDPSSSRDQKRSAGSASAVLSGASAHMLLPAPCPDCGTANVADRKFCSGCGRVLWEPCLGCATVNGAAEKFCGVCGANLVEMVKDRTETYQGLLDQASHLRSQCRHAEAISLLMRVELSDHPRLTLFTTKCHAVADELQAEWQRLQSRRGELFAQAQHDFAERRYAPTAAALQQVHAAMRLPEMQQLLQQVQQVLAELPPLEREIREAVAERRTQGILPKVLRYLELKPDDPPIRELAEKLQLMQQRQLETRRNQLLNLAKQKVAEHEYAMAARLVEQVDPSVRTPDVEKFFDYCQNRAIEVAWLAHDLNEATHYDEHLLPLAERLLKLLPNNDHAKEVFQRIRRLQQTAKPGTARRIDKKTAAEPAGAFGVEVLDGLRNIDDEPIRGNQAYTENYTSFYVACGLALQGLGKAAMPINLLPGQKTGLLGLAASLLRKRSKAAWGINLGSYALKAVKLAFEDERERTKEAEKDGEKDREPRIRAVECEYIPYDEPLFLQMASPELLVRQALEKLLEKHKLGEDAVCLSYPAPKTLARFITLPRTDKKKLADLIRFEAKQQIPFPLDLVTWDHHLTNSSGQGEALVDQEYAILALKSDEAQQFLFPLEELKIKVDCLQAEHVALHNYLAFAAYDEFHKQFASEEELSRDQVVALLDLGANTSNLVIGNRHSLWARTLSIGSHHLNRPLVTEFRLTQEQAEQLKRKPTLGAFASKSYQAMNPTVRDLVGELERSLGYFAHSYRRRRIKQMLIVGGGIRQHALSRLLRDALSDTQREHP